MKQIKLTQGKYAIVDDDMFEYLNQWKWSCSSDEYAVRSGRKVGNKRPYIFMHRLILGTKNEYISDHINGNKLDNRKLNLRFATISENNHNRKLNRNNTSGYKGVYWYKSKGYWRAQVRNNGKRILIGYFKTLKEAVKAYNKVVYKLHGEFAYLNKL